jgi:ABC-2 type transport system permease protein
MTTPITFETGALARRQPRVHSSSVRLLRAEARKLSDTRAGLWLLISGSVATVAVMVIVAVLYGVAHMSLSWFQITGSAGSVLGVFLAVLGILSLTSEWSQRTALTTFALEPRRGRVLLAKVSALAMNCLFMLVLALVCGAAVIAIVRATGGEATWELPPASLAGLAIGVVFNMAMGMAFGLAFANSAAAIVVFFALPMAGTLVMSAGTVFELIATWGPWFLYQPALSNFQAGVMTPTVWGQLATTTLLWIALPSVIGTLRWLRKQVS